MKKYLYTFIFTCIYLTSFSQSIGTASVFQLASIGNITYLIDTAGNTYHSWQCTEGAASTAYLLKDGSIMRPYQVSNPTMNGGAVGGGIEIRDWNNNVTWEYIWSSQNHQQHHECIPIEQHDGSYHALLIAWERKSATEVQQAGGINSEMWPEEIIEIEPVGANGGNVVWKWHAFDHLCQDDNPNLNNYYSSCASHPELLDISSFTAGGGGPQGGGDWIHANGMDYSPQLNQIVFSSHFLHEIFIIDHSTTTAEAATHNGGNSGKGGDILYRWGNPSNYGNNGTRELYTVHGANFIDEGYPGSGNLMCFDNQATSDGGSGNSRVVELQSPIIGYNYNMPWNQVPNWTYSDPGNFYANHLSGAFRTKKGTTLATLGTSTYWREVDMQGNILYEYDFPSSGQGGGNMAKTVAYELDYPGLIGLVSSSNIKYQTYGMEIYPNPANDYLQVLLPADAKFPVEICVLNVLGESVKTTVVYSNAITINLRDLNKGIYLLKAQGSNMQVAKKLIVK